jgi:hypothetical protein
MTAALIHEWETRSAGCAKSWGALRRTARVRRITICTSCGSGGEHLRMGFWVNFPSCVIMEAIKEVFMKNTNRDRRLGWG